jgi:long-subunit fatty acid transport protein
MRKNVLLFFLLSLSHFSFSQKFDLGSWNIVNLKYTMSNKWSAFGEAQIRSLKFYNHFHYYEYKGGINYKANKQLQFTLGAGSYQTFREGGNFISPKNNNEFRLWPQVILFQSIGKIRIEQRYRSELRFTSNGFRDRHRYRLGVSYPFGQERKGYLPFQASISNELFFTSKEPYFERNRLQFAFNFKPTKESTLQLGYLHQFDYKINDEIGRDFLVLGFFHEIFRKQNNERSSNTELKDY